MTHGAETWTLAKQAQNKLAVAQTKMENTYAQHHIKVQKDQHLGQREDRRHRPKQHCEKNEIVLDRAHQSPQRRLLNLACHHLEIIRQEKTIRETSQAVERRDDLVKILEGRDLAEHSTRQANLEAAC